jgi:hypothetical protein
MVDMWILSGHMQKRHPFEEVVYPDLAEKIKQADPPAASRAGR